MSVTINGKKTALDDLPAGTLVEGAPVSIIVKYDNVDHALENLGEERFYIISFQNRLKLLLISRRFNRRR